MANQFVLLGLVEHARKVRIALLAFEAEPGNLSFSISFLVILFIPFPAIFFVFRSRQPLR